ncbi:MAG: ATP-binding cassette domain-containing protein [Oscillospiraceae bacterium]|nr:ATP-binding cassette domain-containing protein [Oscillospiraceae bacterium]
MEKNGIVVRQLHKAFGKQIVLNQVNLEIARGEIAGVVGCNGSGKTVLMKCICGFMKPDSGQIFVDGKQIGKDCDFPENIGIMIETPGFIGHMSGYRNLKMLAALRGRIGRQEILAVLAQVGLSAHMHKPVRKYSLGMRQRLGIAQAIVENPDVLVLDEPFNGLDAGTVEEIRRLLLAFKAQGKAILLASHNAKDIQMLCDKVLEMRVEST